MALLTACAGVVRGGIDSARPRPSTPSGFQLSAKGEVGCDPPQTAGPTGDDGDRENEKRLRSVFSSERGGVVKSDR